MVEEKMRAARRRASRQRALKITSLPNSARKLLPDLVCFRPSPCSTHGPGTRHALATKILRVERL